MERRHCLVCTVPISVTHLGIDACRACAAFFKRAQIASRSYTCRQGDGKCTFRKHEKFMCRSCRYDRCVELGMKYDVPTKRKSRKRAEVEETPPSTSSSSTSTTTTTESILSRVETQYKASHHRRLVQEKEFAVVYNLKRMSHPTEELFISNVTSFYEVFRITIKESVTILQNVFEEFEHLSLPHKVILFKNFLGKFYMAEGVYLSSKYFRNNFNFMASLITCVDTNNVEEWVADTDNIERKEDFRTALRGFSKDYIDLLVPILKMNEFTEREFHALIALAYCDLDPSLDLPEEIIERAREIKAKLFDELQEYYRNELSLKEYSNRLGNLMTIAHGAGEAGNLMNEEMRMYATMFGVYSNDELFRELFID